MEMKILLFNLINKYIAIIIVELLNEYLQNVNYLFKILFVFHFFIWFLLDIEKKILVMEIRLINK
jgi:hypothetical protein